LFVASLRYHVGPLRPEWTGPEEPGAPSPSAGLTTKDVGRRRDVVAVLAGYEDDLSKELTLITDVRGFAEILNEGDDRMQGSQRPQ
jgi:hypothetical protein